MDKRKDQTHFPEKSVCGLSIKCVNFYSNTEQNDTLGEQIWNESHVLSLSGGSLAHKNILLELSDDELDEESLDLLLKLQLNLMELSSAEIPSAGLVTYQKGNKRFGVLLYFPI